MGRSELCRLSRQIRSLRWFVSSHRRHARPCSQQR